MWGPFRTDDATSLLMGKEGGMGLAEGKPLTRVLPGRGSLYG